jgi:hypothetical protein
VIAKPLLALSLAVAATAAPPTKREAALFQQKIEIIRKEQPKRRTLVSQNEIDAYFLFDAARDLPVGIVKPTLVALGPNRVSGSAVVDLDAVRKASPPQSLLDPKNLLIGRLPITATGVLTTSNGVGRFALESASVGGLPLPKLLLQEILSYYSKTPEKPDGISLDDSFTLPVRIREIQVTRGQAIVVQ